MADPGGQLRWPWLARHLDRLLTQVDPDDTILGLGMAVRTASGEDIHYVAGVDEAPVGRFVSTGDETALAELADADGRAYIDATVPDTPEEMPGA